MLILNVEFLILDWRGGRDEAWILELALLRSVSAGSLSCVGRMERAGGERETGVVKG